MFMATAIKTPSLKSDVMDTDTSTESVKPVEKLNGNPVSVKPKAKATAIKTVLAKKAATIPKQAVVKAPAKVNQATTKAPTKVNLAKSSTAKLSTAKSKPVVAQTKTKVKSTEAALSSLVKTPVKVLNKVSKNVSGKVPVKASVKTQVNAKAKVSKVEEKPKAKTTLKVKKPKLVRDSFTMPELEYAILGEVKKACLAAGIEVKKSQLLRIGVTLLNKLDLASLNKQIAALTPLKAGRPKNT
jgi:hypothetical protein